MVRKLGAVSLVCMVAAAGLYCRRKEDAPPRPRPLHDHATQDAPRDHEISISNLRVATVSPGKEYEVTVDVQDAKNDLGSEGRAVAKYQVTCPGGSAHGVLGEPTRVEPASAGQPIIVRHRINIASVKKGTEPCRLRVSVGHGYDFLSNDLEIELPR